VNSEEIKNRFGSYRVKVLQQDQVHRVASLYSEHNDKAVCRTLAVTYFWQPTPTVVIPADTRIRQGHSIGSTLSDAGLILHRQSLLEATAPSGSGFEALSAGTVSQGTPVLLRLYRLDVGENIAPCKPMPRSPKHTILNTTRPIPRCPTFR